MKWVYRPNHPLANKNGMIERDLEVTTATDPRLYVISDTMSPVRHMATGRIHDSKSEFRKDTRYSGCEEVGNDPAAKREKPHYRPTQADIVPDVKWAIEQLKSR
jgi:hypothetical protein